MGYLNNQVITIDAILTNKGRELLAMGDGSFSITQFALGDDEIDYTLYNPTHPSGSAYYGEAIQNMPLMEAFPDETQMMKYKLVTLPRGTVKMPILSGVPNGPLNFLGVTGNSQLEPSGYSFTIADVRVCQLDGGFVASGISTSAATDLVNRNANQIITNGTSVSQTVIGTALTIRATAQNVLFGTRTALYTTLTIIGLDSGARAQVPITVTRTQ